MRKKNIKKQKSPEQLMERQSLFKKLFRFLTVFLLFIRVFVMLTIVYPVTTVVSLTVPAYFGAFLNEAITLSKTSTLIDIVALWFFPLLIMVGVVFACLLYFYFKLWKLLGLFFKTVLSDAKKKYIIDEKEVLNDEKSTSSC